MGKTFTVYRGQINLFAITFMVDESMVAPTVHISVYIKRHIPNMWAWLRMIMMYTHLMIVAYRSLNYTYLSTIFLKLHC